MERKEYIENVPVAISCHRETITKSDLDEMVRQVNENWGKPMPYIVDYESFVVPPTWDSTRGIHHEELKHENSACCVKNRKFMFK